VIGRCPACRHHQCERPIHAGRFNMEKRKSLAEERVDL
jgi:hypothetical protein